MAFVWPASVTMAQKTVNQFSAKQAVDYAMQNSVPVRNALIDIKIQKKWTARWFRRRFPGQRLHFAERLPPVIPTSLLPAEIGGTPGTYFPVQFGVKYNATGGIDLSQLLFDGQVFVGYRPGALHWILPEQADVTKEQIKANVYKIYYQLVVGRKQLGAIDANIERFDKLLNDTRAIYQNGFAEKLDVDKVNAVE